MILYAALNMHLRRCFTANSDWNYSQQNDRLYRKKNTERKYFRQGKLHSVCIYHKLCKEASLSLQYQIVICATAL